MIVFTSVIKQFGQQGEKTGWTYLEIPIDIANELIPGNKKSFRVKGKLDHYPIKRTALLPIGGGRFILPLNASMRKGIGKSKGALLNVCLQVDKTPFQPNQDFMDCLEDDPPAKKFFYSLPPSHQNYFSKWIDSAKTEPTLTRRISLAVNALSHQRGFNDMLRNSQKEF